MVLHAPIADMIVTPDFLQPFFLTLSFSHSCSCCAVVVKPLEVGAVAKHLLPKHVLDAWNAEVRTQGIISHASHASHVTHTFLFG